MPTRILTFRFPASLIDLGDPFFKVYAGLDSTQDFVARSEHSLEELEFLREELEYT